MSANPPPRQIPNSLFRNAEEKDFYVKLLASLRLVFDNQSGNRESPTSADEFNRRYALLVRS